MTKVNVRFLVDQKTNYGLVMEGEEKLIPKEAADLFVKRGIAEYVMKDTIPEPYDPVFDTETMEALVEAAPPPNVNVTVTVKDSDGNVIPELSTKKYPDDIMKKIYIENKTEPLDTEITGALVEEDPPENVNVTVTEAEEKPEDED